MTPAGGAAGSRKPHELVRVDPGSCIVVAAEVEVATTWRRRVVGWIARAAIPEQAALWLPATRMVHTAGLRTAIDVVFLDRSGWIVALRRRLPPWRVAVGPATAVVTVELAPGRAARTGIRIGDRLVLRSHPVSRGGPDG